MSDRIETGAGEVERDAVELAEELRDPRNGSLRAVVRRIESLGTMTNALGDSLRGRIVRGEDRIDAVETRTGQIDRTVSAQGQRIGALEGLLSAEAMRRAAAATRPAPSSPELEERRARVAPVAPEAKRPTHDDAYKVLYAYATCEEAAWHADHEAGNAILEIHGWKRGEPSHQFLADLRRRALAAALDALPAPCPPPVAGSAEDDVERAARALVENRGATYSVATNPPSKFVMIPSAYFEALRAALSRPVRP